MRGRPFQPGNTFGRGRPKGSPNKTTRKMQELLEKYSDSLVGKLISMALKENMGAMRLCMERLYPARRDGLVQMTALGAKNMEEITQTYNRVLKAIGTGTLSPTEGETIARILVPLRQAIESAELEARIEQIEQNAPKNNNIGGRICEGI